MRIEFNPFAPPGQQFTVVGARRDALALMHSHGIDELDAAKRIEAAQVRARHTGKSEAVEMPRPRVHDADINAVEAFIFDKLRVDPGARMTFASFYDAFLAALPPRDRQLWSRKRVSRALPAEHPSKPAGANIRYVLGLAEAA
jgi:hypothetical protein